MHLLRYLFLLGLAAFVEATSLSPIVLTSAIAPNLSTTKTISASSTSLISSCLQQYQATDACCSASCNLNPCTTLASANTTTTCTAGCSQGNGTQLSATSSSLSTTSPTTSTITSTSESPTAASSTVFTSTAEETPSSNASSGSAATTTGKEPSEAPSMSVSPSATSTSASGVGKKLEGGEVARVGVFGLVIMGLALLL